MTVVDDDTELAEAHMRALLGSVGLDVRYVRASGDTLVHLAPDGTEIPVLDLVGGYGTLVFGHNHPELVGLARRLLAEDVPLHAQFSYHPYANELAAALNRIVRRELGTDEPYRAVFGNSGAEGIEIALKHAELDRRIRLDELRTGLADALAAVTAAMGRGEVTAGPEVWAALGLADGGDDPARSLATALTARNDAVLDRQPVLLALEGGFHGKLAGSVQLTHNPGVRMPFAALAAQARFAARDVPGAVTEAAEAAAGEVLEPVADGRSVYLVPHRAPLVGAIFVEPVQGEGGINPLSREQAAEIRATADAHGFPVIVDEVQSGVGRTGAFFAASHVGLTGDYLVLAKAIGGGLAKSAVVLLRGSRYRPDFELVHTSTFAKDAYSCHIGSRVVELLEADDGAAYRRATERGARLRAELDAVAAEFPDVVRSVRGIGLMLGVEFADLSASPVEVLAEQARIGLIGYVFAGYLLHRHRIRIFPTASAPHTLRLEPSLWIDDDAVHRTGAALRALCAVLRDGDPAPLFARPTT